MPNSSGDTRKWNASIPTFSLNNREGYSTWKFKMRHYLMHEDLWVAIVGYPVSHSISVETQKKNDIMALTKICLTLENSAITHVRSAKTAVEAWKALQIAYEDKGMGRRLYLERKLYRYSLSDFDGIEGYINAVISTAQDLADIGKIIEDASVAAILLGGLTSRYDPLIMAVENSNIEVTTELVKVKLLNEMSKYDDSTKIDSVLRSNDVKSKNKKKKKPIVCYDCNEPGHKRPDCPNKMNNKGKALVSGVSLGSKDVDNFALGSKDVDNVALGSKDVDDNYWIIDSGATRHMSSKVEWFENLTTPATKKKN